MGAVRITCGFPDGWVLTEHDYREQPSGHDIEDLSLMSLPDCLFCLDPTSDGGNLAPPSVPKLL